MSILDFIVRRRDRIRDENFALKLALSGVEERLFTEMAYSRKLAEDRDALLAQNCRLRAQRDDALVRRKRDEKGRFR
ncbi:hypothetical protein NQF87_03435 [Bombella sp. TMW 2.2559]|uniref:DUF3563 domain-containing protein n=1 Tax=Bombella dulcis TaxID=2967339 RepID=A0ABT3WB37_9PROT|nr:hypothetical protein [Bombella dulcis]MCX5616028.1 hypothetical protein [Bombella dulcis]